MDRDQLKITFSAALTDVFMDEEERSLKFMPKVDLKNAEANVVFTEMFYAFQMAFNVLTNNHCDPIDFIQMLTRLLFEDQINHINDNPDFNGGESDE